MYQPGFLIKSGVLAAHFLIFFSIHAISQGYSNYNWYFGNTTDAIRFNKEDAEPDLVNNAKTPLGMGGSAVATEANSGDVLFYTSGATIYDAANNIMRGGQGLNGNPAINQPVAISPVPGEPQKFYVFSNNLLGIHYTTVDISLQGNAAAGSPALGAVESSNTLLHNNPTSEAMVLFPGAGETQWLIVQNGNGTYQVFEFSTSGITSEPFNLNAAPAISAANFAYNGATGKIAVSPKNQNTNVQILDFDPATGILSFDQEIPNTGNSDFATEAIYDTEWSSDGSKLYISRHGADADNVANVLQYDFNASPPILSPEVMPISVFRSYGLKMGPDNIIYNLYQQEEGGEYYLGAIHQPDSSISFVTYEFSPLSGRPDLMAKQFPEFAASILDDCGVDFEVSNTCANSPAFFTPTFTSTPESFSWNFGDNNSASVQSPTHIYEAEGQYLVELIFSCNGVMDTIAKNITIDPNDLQINIPSDTTICPGETLELDATTEGATSYRWSIRDESGQPITTPTVSVDSAGYYWVVATDGSGCEAYAGSNVKVYGEENRIGNIWYFGDGAGIDFNEEPPVAIADENQVNTPEGVAVMSDRNGDVLFYTDGVTVWNLDNQVIDTDLGGDQESTQSSLIVPFPEDETLYYIFTTDAVFGTDILGYSILDIKGNNGLGEILVKNVPLFERSTERITAIQGSTTTLLAHEFGNNTFRAYPITVDGIGNPTLSSIGSVHNGNVQANGEGYMKFSSDGNKIAVALPGPPNAVELFDYVDSTQEVTNFIRLELPDGEMPYGIEFSPDGDMLYVSVNNNGSGPSKLYQYQLIHGNDTIEDIANRNEILSGPEAFGALQIGSDQQIYMAVDGASAVKQITGPNANADSTTINPIDFDLAGRTSRLGLPNFIQSIFDQVGEPTMSYTNLCVGNESTFSGTGTSDIDEYLWNIINAAGETVHSANAEETTFIFETAGTYTLNFNISNRCGLDTTLTEQIEVVGSPDPPTLPAVFGICTGSDTLEAAPEGTAGLTYLWSTGETTRTIVPNLLGLYSVTNTNAEGCSSFAETIVFDGRPTVDLGPDAILCQNENLVLEADYAGAGITWTLIDENGLATDLNNPSVRQTVDTSLPGIFQYTADITDPLTGCVGSDTVQVTVNEIPVFTLAPTGSSCSNADGSIGYDITTTGNYTIAWTDTDGNDLGDANPLTGISAGIYTLTVTDPVSGCSTSESVGLEDAGADIFEEIEPVPYCDLGIISVALNINAQFPVTYELYNALDNTLFASQASTNESPYPFQNVPAGDYIVQVTQADGCIKSDTVTLDVLDSIQFEVIEEFVQACVEPGQVTDIGVENPNGSYTYLWTNIDAADSTAGITFPDQPLTPVSQSGRYMVSVTDPSGTICPASRIVEVELNNDPTVNIIADEDACDGIMTLEANVAPDGNYSYLWSTGEITPTIILTNPGTYNVTLDVLDQATGCVASTSLEVTLQTALEIQLTSSFACEGEPFTLTAESNLQNVIYTWRGPDGIIIENETSNQLIVAAGQPDGNYTVSGQSEFGCTSEASQFVERAMIDAGQLPERVVICPEDDNPEINSTLLDPGIFFSYAWIFPDGSTSNSSTVVADMEGLYKVTLTNSLGCSTQDSTLIVANCEPEIYGPNAFSPNDNSQNETFRLFSKYLTDFEIFIFNRWGEIIFQSSQPDFEWDGIYNGQVVPVGVYPYRVTYKSSYNPDRGVLEKRGSITVVR